MMKKAMALVLALALAASTFIAGAAFSDVPADHKNAQAINLLSQMKVLQGKEGDNYDPAGTLTRAEACAIVYRVTTGQVNTPTAPAANVGFSDVSDQHWAGKYIQYCAGLGVVDGYPGDVFKPDQAVTYAEFVTMMVRALGIDTTGYKFPDSYMSTAGAQGMTANVNLNNDDPAARADVAEVTYNTMFEADYVRAGQVDNGNYSDIAAEVFEMEKGSLKVVGANGAVTDSNVKVDRTLAGQQVQMYKVNNVPTYAIPTQNNTEVATVKASDLEIDTYGTIKVNGKEVKANNMTAYYNFVNTGAGVTKANVPTTYTFISNDGDDTNYEAVIARVKEYGTVKSIAATGKSMVVRVNKQDITVDLSSEKVSVYEGAKVGDKVAITDYTYGAALSSSNNKITDATIAKVEKQTGAVSSVNGDVYTINGTEYKMRNSTEGDKFANGAVCNFYAVDGIIMQAEVVNPAANYAYILNETTVNGGDQAIRMVLSDGTTKIYATTPNAEDTPSETAEGMVKYALNSDEKVFAEDMGGTSLGSIVEYKAELMQLKNDSAYVYLTEDTIVFVKDKNNSVKVVKAADLGDFTQADNLNEGEYVADSKGVVEVLFLDIDEIPAAAEQTDDQTILVTSDMSTTYETTYMNGFEEKVEYKSFTAYVNGVETECKILAENITGGANVKKGATVTAAVNKAGEVKGVSADVTMSLETVKKVQGSNIIKEDNSAIKMAEGCKVVTIIKDGGNFESASVGSVAELTEGTKFYVAESDSAGNAAVIFVVKQ